jgi:hypothetical protein
MRFEDSMLIMESGHVKHKSLHEIRTDNELFYQGEHQAPYNQPLRLRYHAGWFPNRKQCNLVVDHL